MIFNVIDDFYSLPYILPNLRDYDEMDRQTIGFISHVLNKYPQILDNNTRTFIPGHIRRKGHNDIRDLIFNVNSEAVIAVINGIEKTLQFKDTL